MLTELTDAQTEQLCGGGIITPNAKAGKTPSTPGNSGTSPNMGDPLSVGLTPFFPPLPARKMPGLGRLKKSSSTGSTGTEPRK